MRRSSRIKSGPGRMGAWLCLFSGSASVVIGASSAPNPDPCSSTVLSSSVFIEQPHFYGQRLTSLRRTLLRLALEGALCKGAAQAFWRPFALSLALTITLTINPLFAAEKIRFGLNWLPEAEHCGFFQAKAAGLYDKAGKGTMLRIAANPDKPSAGRIDWPASDRTETERSTHIIVLSDALLAHRRRGREHPPHAVSVYRPYK